MSNRKKAITRRRRLEVDDVLVVEKSKLRTAISGTVVGNFMGGSTSASTATWP